MEPYITGFDVYPRIGLFLFKQLAKSLLIFQVLLRIYSVFIHRYLDEACAESLDFFNTHPVGARDNNLVSARDDSLY